MFCSVLWISLEGCNLLLFVATTKYLVDSIYIEQCIIKKVKSASEPWYRINVLRKRLINKYNSATLLAPKFLICLCG